MKSSIIAPIIASSALLLLTNAAPHNQPTKRDFQNVYNCNVQGQAALTFDDGPFNYDQQISGELNGGKATFFFNGNNYGCIYDYADDIIALHNAGHTLGNHGWSHKDFTTLSWDEIHDELWRVEEAFVKILGLKPKYFRPPYGNTNSLLESALQNRGYTRSFLWSADSGDSTGASVQESQGVYDGVANSYPQPALVLNHSPVQTTADQVVPYAVGQLAGRGYQLVAVDTCLGSSGEWPYYYIQEPGQRDDTWHC